MILLKRQIMIKREIVEKVLKEIFQEEPHLDPNTEDLLKIIEIAYRKGYEAAIKYYGNNQ